MNMPTLGKDHPSIHQDNLNGSRPHVDEKSIKVGGTPTYHHFGWIFCPSPHQGWFGLCHLPWKTQQITIWTHIHMSSSPLLMNGIPQFLTMIPPPLDGLDPQSNA